MQYAAILWVVLLVVPFFIFFVRPQRRQVQAIVAMQSRLVVGDVVVTTSGIYGTIVAFDDDTAEIEIAQGTTVKIVRRAIGRRLADSDPDADMPDADMPDADMPVTSVGIASTAVTNEPPIERVDP